jgi:hypothetical protein
VNICENPWFLFFECRIDTTAAAITPSPVNTEAEAAPTATTEDIDRRYRNHVRPNPRILESLLPVGVYFVVNVLWGTVPGIAASFAATILIFARNRSHGTIRLLAVLGFVITTGAAALGLISGSGKIYVAQNLITDFVFAGVFAASVAVGRPLIGSIVHEVVPAVQPVMAVDHPLFARLTLVSAAINVAEGLGRAFMLQALSDNAYIILSRAVFLPLGIAFYFLCYVLVQREAIRIWPANMPAPNRDGTAGS